jgi:dTDP-glucose 4,6-dehydratase
LTEFKSCILVTGAAGFIGSHFCRQTVATHDNMLVVALDKAPLEQFHLNLGSACERGMVSMGSMVQTREEMAQETKAPHIMGLQGHIGNRELMGEVFAKLKPSIVYNFAAESHVDRSIDDAAPFIDSNIWQLQALLEEWRRYVGAFKKREWMPKFVQISTDEVYGDYRPADILTASEEECGFNEKSRANPSSPYAASKAAADMLVMAYGRTYGIKWVITRSSNNYGPHQAPEKLIPLVIDKAGRGEEIPLYGDGKQKRDWIYVMDNVMGIGAAAGIFTNSIVNIGSNDRIQNLNMVETIHMLMDSKSPICMVADRPGHDREYRINANKLRETGWRPAKSLRDGVKQTIDWYREHQNWVEGMKRLGFTTDRVGLGEKDG